MVKSILFVCTGNLCRSPMAEGLMKKELENYPSRVLKVSSAGVFTIDGRLASEPAILVMSEMGVDIMGHHSTRVTEQLIRESDLVVVMETSHRDVLLNIVPELAERIKIMGNYLPGSNNSQDIDDPYGLGLAEYRQCARQIYSCVKNLIQKEIMENN